MPRIAYPWAAITASATCSPEAEVVTTQLQSASMGIEGAKRPVVGRPGAGSYTIL
jgi:hypothetical protein